MKHVKSTIPIRPGRAWSISHAGLWCFIFGHVIERENIRQSMWREREKCLCKRCGKEWIEIGFLNQD